MSDRYVLDADGNPTPEPDLMKWGAFMQKGPRHLEKTELPGDVLVSTVFLGMDHSFIGGPPVLWETMIFGGPHNDYQKRYTSIEDARAGHDVAVRLARGEITAEAAS